MSNTHKRKIPKGVHKMQIAIAAGANTFEDVAKLSGYHDRTVRRYDQEYSSHFPSKEISQDLRKVQRAYGMGIDSLNDVITYTQLTHSELLTLKKSYNISIPGIKSYKQKKATRIDELINIEKMGIKEISQALSLNPTTIINYISDFHISHPFSAKQLVKLMDISNRIKERDDLVDSGLTLEKIAERCGVTRERIRQYYIETDQHEKFLAYRKKTKTYVPRYQSHIAAQIETVALRQVHDTDKWAYQKALEFDKTHKKMKKSPFTFQNVYHALQLYDHARSQNQKLSIQEISDQTRLKTHNISRLLVACDLPTLVRPTCRTTRQKNLKKDFAN